MAYSTLTNDLAYGLVRRQNTRIRRNRNTVVFYTLRKKEN